MSLHLHRTPHPPTSTATELRMLMAFEAGNVECLAFRPTHGKPHSIEGLGWERLWNVRFHAESGSCLFVSPASYPITPCTEMGRSLNPEIGRSDGDGGFTRFDSSSQRIC